MMKNMQAFMKQAQEIQRRIEEAQARLAETEVTGQAGGGLVKVTINGKSDMKKLVIDPSLLVPEDKEVLEDLIIAAFADAKGQAEKSFADAMGAITGGALPPGLKLPF
jgi:DNA-binding YbaB/EbfC family protein